MSTETPVEIAQLRLKNALELAPLVAAYAQALKRGAPGRPDQFYAERLLQDRTAELLGARLSGRLVGFLIFYDLPEPVSGARYAQVDHIYVDHPHRNVGIGQALIDVLAEQAEARDWSKIILNAPRFPEEGRKLYEKIAVKADWTSWIMRFRT